MASEAPALHNADGKKENRWRLGVVAALLATLLWCHFTSGGPDFTRWDNFEYFTPILIEEHSQWLKGTIPVWNRHQQLGEPILAIGQTGALYLPYTLLLAGMRGLHVPDRHFLLVIVLLHLPLMGLGCYQLLRAFRVRPSFSFLAAVNVPTAGYLTLYESVWIVLSPIFAWLPWILLGLVLVLNDRRRRAGTLLVAVGLAAVGLVGHPQFTVYAWLLAVLSGLGFAWCSPLGVWQGGLRMLPGFLAGACFSAPAILPVLYHLPNTERSTDFPLEVFLNGSLPVGTLPGFLSPLYRTHKGWLGPDMPMMCHMGTWLPLSILGAGIVFLTLRRRPNTLLPSGRVREFWTLLAIGTLLLSFALGKAGLIYPLTYGIPVWSSFRWPNKFLPYAHVALGLAGGIGLEMISGQFTQAVWARRASAAVCLVVGAVLFVVLDGVYVTTPSGILSMVAVAGIVVGFLEISHRWGRGLLVASAIASAMATMGLTQLKDMKTYPEPYASIGADQLGIDTSHYVLPLSHYEWSHHLQPSSMQSHANYHSATMNGYLCATGHVTALAPRWYLRCLPSTQYGFLLPGDASELIQGAYPPALGIKYLIVSPEDTGMFRIVDNLPGVRRVGTCEGAAIFEYENAAPLVYFASELESASRLKELFFQRQSFNGTAAIDNPSSTGKLPADAEVNSATFSDSGRVDIEVDAPSGGFLVINQTYYPQWKAWVDGKPTTIQRTNGFVQGLILPAGSHRIELRWRSAGLFHGLIIAAYGLVILWITLRRCRPSRQEE